jgi:hypothetical protein
MSDTGKHTPPIERLKIDYALQLVRARYGGCIPSAITVPDCIELMHRFAEVQEKIADQMNRMYLEVLAMTPPKPILVSAETKPEGV